MPKITAIKGGFNIQHTTREVWGVDDDDAPESEGQRVQRENEARVASPAYRRAASSVSRAEKAIRAGVR